jgi:conjugal transfer pilus assembly protein TraI
MFGLFQRFGRRDGTQVQAMEPAFRGSAYASVDPGIALVPVEELVAGHADLMRRIRLAFGSDERTFDAQIGTLVRSYARFCHLLPATADNFFNDQGGLFRMGLEIGFLALQGTDGYIFSNTATITERAQLEPRWRYATFIAGLLSEAHRALSHVIVTGEDGRDWPAYLEPLHDWAASRGFQRYFLRWRSSPVETRSLGLFAARLIVDGQVLQTLDVGHSPIVSQMLGAIGGIPSHRQPNLIERLVRTCTAVVIQRNLVATASRYGRPIIGAHLERYLVDAMQRLVADGTWSVNGAKSRLWYGQDGLYLVWPNAASDIVRLLEKDRVPGVPKSPVTIAEILVSAGVIERHEDGGAVFRIAVEGASQAVGAVRLSSPQILLGSMEQAPRRLDREIAIRGAPSLLSPQPADGASLGEAPESASAASPVSAVQDSADADEGGDEEPSGSAQPANGNDSGVQQRRVAQPAQAATARSGARAHGAESKANPPPQPSLARFALQAPVHLNPAVRAALGEIVESLNNGASAECCTTPKGLFIPLEQFVKHAVDTAVAVSALFDSGMLVGSSSQSRTVQHEFDGQMQLGVCIHPRYIAGLEAEAFSL